MPKPLTITCTGYSIAADWYQGTDTDRILLVLPGYSSSKANQKELVAALVAQTGASALVIDYSGHGESPFELKDTRPAQHCLEVIQTFDWLKTTYPESTIWVMGSSYGGFLATQLTKYRQFDKLILRAPAIYRPEEFYTLWAARLADEAAYAKQIALYRHDRTALAKHPLLAQAGQFQGKTLVMVHGSDEIVPAETTDAYIKIFNADSFTAEGLKHKYSQVVLDPQQIRDYQNQIAGWLQAN